jgi:hypothetical protein
VLSFVDLAFPSFVHPVEVPSRIKGESERGIVEEIVPVLRRVLNGGIWRSTTSPAALAPSFASLLQYASLRGLNYALLDSSLLLLPRPLSRDIPY